MINPILTSELANAHRCDLLKEAAIARLTREARTDRPGLGSRMLASAQSNFLAFRRRLTGRMDTTEAGHAAAEAVIFGDR